MKYKKKEICEVRNFHFGSFAKNPRIEKEWSDGIFRMSGRGTGHFGSGTYFATYSDNEELEDIRYDRNDDLTVRNDELVSIDLDLVPNMFKVRNESLAQQLFDTLKMLNNGFYLAYDKLKEGEDVKPKLIELYRRFKHRFSDIGIDVMTLKRFFEIFMEAGNDYDKRMSPEGVRNGSISTRVMTDLGFSGVDVSGVKGWDNTLHGSVVYDINNYKNLIQNVSNNPYAKVDDSKKIKIENPLHINEKPEEEVREYFNYKDMILFNANSFDMLNNKYKQLYLRSIVRRIKNQDDSDNFQTMLTSNEYLWLRTLLINFLPTEVVDPYLTQKIIDNYTIPRNLIWKQIIISHNSGEYSSDEFVLWLRDFFIDTLHLSETLIDSYTDKENGNEKLMELVIQKAREKYGL